MFLTFIKQGRVVFIMFSRVPHCFEKVFFPRYLFLKQQLKQCVYLDTNPYLVPKCFRGRFIMGAVVAFVATEIWQRV